MKTLCLLLVAVILAVAPAPSSASDGTPPAKDSPSVTPLRNKDVLEMVKKKVESDSIVRLIKSSPCNFDTFPPVLQDLKRRGVPDEVLQAMVEAPYGPSANSKAVDEAADQPIYHYTEQLKAGGFLSTTATAGRRSRARTTRADRRQF